MCEHKLHSPQTINIHKDTDMFVIISIMMLYSIVYFNYQNHNDLKPSRGKINNNINKQQTQQSYTMTVKCHRSYGVGTGTHEPKPKKMNTVRKTLQ